MIFNPGAGVGGGGNLTWKSITGLKSFEAYGLNNNSISFTIKNASSGNSAVPTATVTGLYDETNQRFIFPFSVTYQGPVDTGISFTADFRQSIAFIFTNGTTFGHLKKGDLVILSVTNETALFLGIEYMSSGPR